MAPPGRGCFKDCLGCAHC